MDVLIGAGDYHHIETKLLAPAYQSYSAAYWDSRVMAPSSLLYYVGLNKKLEGVLHHQLFFDTDFYDLLKPFGKSTILRQRS